jgi:hypothetical protein
MPTPSSFTVQSPRPSLSEEATVNQLIDQTMRSLNMTKLSVIFQEEAKIIYNIPLSPLLPKDRMIWRCTEMSSFLLKAPIT